MNVHQPALNDLVEHGEDNPSSIELRIAVEVEKSSRVDCPTTSEHNRYLPASEQARENEDFCDIYRCESDPSVSSGTSAMTIPSRQYSYGNHFYPTASESSVEFDEWSNASSTAPPMKIRNREIIVRRQKYLK
jgi:hypothetical protein